MDCLDKGSRGWEPSPIYQSTEILKNSKLEMRAATGDESSFKLIRFKPISVFTTSKITNS